MSTWQHGFLQAPLKKPVGLILLALHPVNPLNVLIKCLFMSWLQWARAGICWDIPWTEHCISVGRWNARRKPHSKTIRRQMHSAWRFVFLQFTLTECPQPVWGKVPSKDNESIEKTFNYNLYMQNNSIWTYFHTCIVSCICAANQSMKECSHKINLI